jgi:hypothetical protein
VHARARITHCGARSTNTLETSISRNHEADRDALRAARKAGASRFTNVDERRIASRIRQAVS